MKKLSLAIRLAGFVALIFFAGNLPKHITAAEITQELDTQTYVDKKQGYSFEFSTDLEAYPQPIFYDLTSVVSLINETKYPDSEIAINSFSNPGLTIADWLNQHDETDQIKDWKPLGGKLDKPKVISEGIVYQLSYKVLHNNCETILIWTEHQVFTISLYFRQKPKKELLDSFDHIISTFDVNPIGKPARKYKTNIVFETISTQSLLKYPSIQLAQAATTIYKLPWQAGIPKRVTQGWSSGYSHIGSEQYAYDFSHTEGEDVLASASGTVAFLQGTTQPNVCGYGNTYAALANRVVLNHNDGTSTLYLHLHSTTVQLNSQIKAGQVIGKAGKTGWTKGPLPTDECGAHLHFQRQAQGSWYTTSQAVYFAEYPNQQLFLNTDYTSANTGLSTPSNLILVQAIDYDGDGRKDTTYFDPANGQWHINKSGSNWAESVITFTNSNPMPVGGSDFDGDGRTDLAVFNQTTGEWKIRYSNNGSVENKGIFGWNTCIPVGGVNINKDTVNGRPRHDMAIYDRASGYWYIRPSSGGNDIVISNLGWSSAIPVVGNYKYDSDNKVDIGIFDTLTGQWYIRPSVFTPTQGGNDIAVQFGWNSTTPLSNGDYDDDGKTDLAMWDRNSGRWYVRPSNGGLDWDILMGWGTTIPIQGFNFMSTTRASLGIFDYNTATWYLRPQAGQADWVWTWGNSGVTPF